jgi:hypothetical protein
MVAGERIRFPVSPRDGPEAVAELKREHARAMALRPRE